MQKQVIGRVYYVRNLPIIDVCVDYVKETDRGACSPIIVSLPSYPVAQMKPH